MSRARRKCLIGLYIVHQFTLKIIHSFRSQVFVTQYNNNNNAYIHMVPRSKFRVIEMFTFYMYPISYSQQFNTLVHGP